MATDPTWIITTSGDRPIAEVASEIGRRGFSVGQVLEEVGAITGSCSEDVAKQLRSIRGVADVSRDHAIDLGPPDAPVTW